MSGLRWITGLCALWMYAADVVPVLASGSGPREFVAVVGGRAALPCNITAPSDDDSVALAMWYKGDMKVPIYTLDARRGKAVHFPSSRLGRRFHFDTHGDRPGLAVDPVRQEDDGLYRCRVEYRHYRTLSYTYELKVIVPPREVNILDERGQRIEDTVGPVDEGANVTLTCEAEGGSPKPSVTWWRDSVLLDDTWHLTTQGYIRNDLLLEKVRRSDLSAAFTCQAANSNLSVPVSASVSLDLNLRPLNVKITSDAGPLSAGRPVSLDCESAGSRPRALMAWWKGGQRARAPGGEVLSDNGNLTLSALSFVPAPDDHGKRLVCSAENPALPSSRLEAARTLVVHYIPELRLALGASIQHTAIKEGSDVYFDCNVRARPWVHEVGWRFEGRPLAADPSRGVIVSNQSLVLQRVKKEHRGRYQCVATNAEGEGRSEEVYLGVQFAPVCKSKPGQVFGVAKHETLNVTCELEADPRSVVFHWALNNTVENMDVRDFTADGATSTAYYVPRNIQGYGALLCWGSNSMGKQKSPCVFRVVPVADEEDSALSPMIAILIGIVSALTILFIVVAIIVRRRTREKHKDSHESKHEKCEIPLQNYKEESIDSTIESPDVIPSDTQVYGPDSKIIQMECTRRMNEEMYKILKQKQDKYDALLPLADPDHSEMVVDEMPYGTAIRGGYPTQRTLRMEPPAEYADAYRRGLRAQVLPVSDALDKRAPELPLINDVQQTTMENWRQSNL